MIILTAQPEDHTSLGRWDCARCEWARLHYNLVHHVRIRQEYNI